MKTLIVFYSFTQNNLLLAKEIHRRLGGDILEIETVGKRVAFSIFLDLMFNRKPSIRMHQLTLRDYDHIVFIAPIWAGKIAGPLKTFLSDEKNNIRRYSFITLCGGIAGQRERIEQQLQSILSTPPEKVSELWISELVIDKKARNVSGYRIQQADWEKYGPKIDEFCRSLKTEPVRSK